MVFFCQILHKSVKVDHVVDIEEIQPNLLFWRRSFQSIDDEDDNSESAEEDEELLITKTIAKSKSSLYSKSSPHQK